MDAEEPPRRSPDDPLAALARQDLDPLSVAELHARIRALEAEIERVRSKLAQVESVRSAADQLFRRR